MYSPFVSIQTLMALKDCIISLLKEIKLNETLNLPALCFKSQRRKDECLRCVEFKYKYKLSLNVQHVYIRDSSDDDDDCFEMCVWRLAHAQQRRPEVLQHAGLPFHMP